MNVERFLEALRQGCADPVHVARYHGGGKKQAQPDYASAAQAQAQGSKEATTAATWANRPTINTPWGSQTWDASAGVDPSTGQPITQWESNINLSPEQQQAQAAQMDITAGRSEAAKTLLGQATESFQQPFDWGGMPAVPGSLEEAQSGAYSKMSAMQEPGRDRQREALRTRLANQGLAQGTEAFKRAEADLSEQFGTQDKSMMAQALSEGRADVGAQQGLRGSAIAEQAQRRGMTLNELNALLTGQQVSMPQMPGFQNAGTAQAPQMLNAAQMQGQQQQANQMDWGSLAGAGMMAAGMAGMF